MRQLLLIFFLLLPAAAAAQNLSPDGSASAPQTAPVSSPESEASDKPEPTQPETAQPGSADQSATNQAPTPSKSEPSNPAAPASSGTTPTERPDPAEKPSTITEPTPAANPIKVEKPKRRLRTAVNPKLPRPAAKPPATTRPIPFNPAAPAKFAGTYRIESWKSLEQRNFYHFFYLQPGGTFLLGAEWPGRETSRAAGKWQATGEFLTLEGTISVSTNKGRWKVPFRRTFQISLGDRGIRLEPTLEKNRFGLLGWPNAYDYFRTRVSPNLPSNKIPLDPAKLDALIAELRNSGG